MTLPGRVGDRDVDPLRPLRTRADWVDAVPASEGIRMYFDVLRGRLWLIVLATAFALATAFILVSRAEKVYEAEAGLLVTPVPRTNTALFGLGLVSETGDPTRDAETLAQLATTSAVAERVRQDLGTDRSTASLRAAVDALPVAQSSIVAITAEADDPEEAARLANAFGEAAIRVRTERLHAVLDDVIPRLRAQLEGVPAGEEISRQTLSDRIRTLEALRFQSDPTLHFETRATPPRGAVAPRPVLTLAAALVGGLVIGVALVLLLHIFNTRIEREQDLARYRIPILGRVPREGFLRRLRYRVRGRIGGVRPAITGRGPFTPRELSPEGLDAYRYLASQFVFGADRDGGAIFVTSAGPNDGKTTTSINVSAALGRFGEAVVLADADSRRPGLQRFVAGGAAFGLDDVAQGLASPGEAVETASALPGVEILANSDRDDGGAGRLVDAQAADALVREVTTYARWLVIDGPALAYAPEALPLASSASTVLIVVRLRATRARDLAGLAELLMQHGITPAGFVVIGAVQRPLY